MISLKFVKESMNLRNFYFAEIISENTYPALLIIATFRFEDDSDERGRYYFGVEEGFQFFDSEMKLF